MQRAGVDRLDALVSAIDIVRRGGTISLIGVYGGMADPLPMLTLFDKQIQLRMGQGQRQEVGRRHHAALHRRRPAGRRHLRLAGAVKIILKPSTNGRRSGTTSPMFDAVMVRSEAVPHTP